MKLPTPPGPSQQDIQYQRLPQLLVWPVVRDIGEEKSSIGFATIKRDRFVALEASFDTGEIVTRPLQLKGTTLHLNAKSDFGEIIVELLDANDKLLSRSTSIQRDSLDIPVVWTGGVKQPHESVARLRIKLKNARLFALWGSQ